MQTLDAVNLCMHLFPAPDAYLLLSQKSEISRLVVDFDRYENDDGDIIDNPEVTLPIHGMKNIKALAYDPVGQHIYWIEGRQRVIKRSHDNGSDVRWFNISLFNVATGKP